MSPAGGSLCFLLGGRPTKLVDTNRLLARAFDYIRWRYCLRDKIHRFSEHAFCRGILSGGAFFPFQDGLTRRARVRRPPTAPRSRQIHRNRPGGATCVGGSHRLQLRIGRNLRRCFTPRQVNGIRSTASRRPPRGGRTRSAGRRQGPARTYSAVNFEGRGRRAGSK